MDMTKIMSYFDKTGNTYYIKKGYICILEGFVDDYISMIRRTEDSGLRLYSMASDNLYIVDCEIRAKLHVYSLTEMS